MRLPTDKQKSLAHSRHRCSLVLPFDVRRQGMQTRPRKVRPAGQGQDAHQVYIAGLDVR